MRALLTLVGTDLRQRVRDRSVIIFGIVVPLALMSVLNLVLPDPSGPELGTTTVAASWTEQDPMADSIVQALQGAGLDLTVDRVEAGQVRAAVADGRADVGLEIPADFDEALGAGAGPVVHLVEGDDAGVSTLVVHAVVQGTLDSLTAGTVLTTAAIETGLSPDDALALAQEPREPLITPTEGQAADEQLDQSAALVAGQAGLFLMFTVGFGVLALTAERQQGTLARLYSMPIRRSLVVLSKGVTSFILGIVATTVLLVAGSLLFDVSFGSVPAVAVLVVAVVAATTSLMFVVARVAKTAEQAGVAQSILAMVLGVAGGAFFPVAATGLLSRVLDLNPIAAFLRGLGTTSAGGGLTDVAGPLVTMLGFAVVAIAVSRLVPDRGAEA